jgi:RimJ/RimL family protein N-acetyltransferase
MKTQPVLETERLILRPFSMEDAPTVQKLAGDRAIAETTLMIPHPYPDGVAESWISSHAELFKHEKQAIYSIVIRENSVLIGAIALIFRRAHESAELAYWIGKPYWNNGYCTEAANEILRFGFQELGLNRIHAEYFSNNTASGRILEKIGMKYEGCLRQHVKKWDQFIDLKKYGILKEEYF